jgi:hypothetical protein
MRDDLDLAYDYDRPSRLSRVVVLLSTLGVAGIAIWVFSPILLANYNAYMARTTIAKSTAPVEASRMVAAVAPVAPAAAAVAPAAPPTSDTTAAATR